MGRFGSLVIAAAREAAVPAGSALAVDRERFARRVTATLEGEPLVEVRRRELLTVEGVADVVVADGAHFVVVLARPPSLVAPLFHFGN